MQELTAACSELTELARHVRTHHPREDLLGDSSEKSIEVSSVGAA
ncbi:hypothetical protein ACFQYP_20110 [Nonomuraea antimicrobica]